MPARRPTIHSTGAESACFSSARLDAWLDSSRPVNSGVRLLLNAIESKIYCCCFDLRLIGECNG